MADPLSITASAVGITTAALGSIKLLYTTIGDIKNVPTALENIRSDLRAVELVLQKLRTALESQGPQMILFDNIKVAVENFNSACSTFQKTLDHWMRHATKHKTFWAEWTDQVRVGIFEQGTINVLKGRLSDCKSTLAVALNTSSTLTVTRQGFMMEEMKDSMLKNIESFLDEEKARANREFAAIESSLEKLSLSIQHEFNEDSKRSLQQLLREMQEQRASNKVFRITCEQALLKTKNVHDGIEQEIKNTKADKNSKAVAGIMNASGKVQNVKQNLSDTIATDGSLAAAGIIHDVDLSISSSKDE